MESINKMTGDVTDQPTPPPKQQAKGANRSRERMQNIWFCLIAWAAVTFLVPIVWDELVTKNVLTGIVHPAGLPSEDMRYIYEVAHEQGLEIERLRSDLQFSHVGTFALAAAILTLAVATFRSKGNKNEGE